VKRSVMVDPAPFGRTQVLKVKELIKRGLGVHHAGMLPILKEVGTNGPHRRSQRQLFSCGSEGVHLSSER